jgi:hypothetical protein
MGIKGTNIGKNQANPKHPVLGHFAKEFKSTFKNPNPNLEDVEQIFEWLKGEAQSALSFVDINDVDYCRRIAEEKFSRFTDFKIKVLKKSCQVRRELKNRFDELRTTRKVIKGRFSVFQGQKEEEKVLPLK